MALYSSAPPERPFSDAKPTLLVAWWITLFCTCLILLRLSGRYIRVEKLFIEDKITALALIPLYLRIACTHVVLLYGTNNIQLDGLELSSKEINQRIIASKIVLAGRIFYAATIWTLKFTTLEFLNRLAGASSKRLYSLLINVLRGILAASFVAIIVSTLAECQPISHYWQIIPDPGPQCRQGVAQLLTMGVSSAVIDAILIIFPIPIIISTRIHTRRKILLAMLFCFGFLTVGITIYRIPETIKQHGDQVVRSMWASIELLAATTVANLVALGSFLRDSGARKNKFRPDYNSSGTTSRPQGQGTATSDWYQAENEHRADTAFQSSAASGSGVSPTQSHDSLIQPDHGSSQAAAVLGLETPRSPEPLVPAGMTSLRRR
ncbi:uncharacterized protein TRIVIDRAFT_192678 [Trichoderma virens Gv29-8]|uniref:Rhodopsin domain-containing protein n=1 Tax=Hypocrea virens (strain Gv29-8 / FGSC 10586) TaxID=413071 RepID=G9MY13_HYPVG|nr:uncharacterized protein TRIVIDRAFT_192678 [Trichoderma virens Gv29-8]EHK20773.1 hypothetical protein TRIVIDRAFT_192678 [Trichoderma virens Gv29-8]